MIRGILYEKQGLPDEAMKCYDNSIKLNPNFDSAYLNKGLIK